jgi:hypothetical protein
VKVIVEFYFNDLEQRCSNSECDFHLGPYAEEWFNPWCPQCEKPLQFFRAFGTVEQRSCPVEWWEARVSGEDY